MVINIRDNSPPVKRINTNKSTDSIRKCNIYPNLVSPVKPTMRKASIIRIKEEDNEDDDKHKTHNQSIVSNSSRKHISQESKLNVSGLSQDSNRSNSIEKSSIHNIYYIRYKSQCR